VKEGDLVTHDRSHIDKSNFFYDSWLQIGIVLSIELNPPTSHGADIEVFWASRGKHPSIISWEDEISLEVISESG